MKKKYLMRLGILSCLLLFALSGYSYASWSIGEFEFYGSQVYKNINIGNFSYSTWFNNFINSNAYYNKKYDIPFDSYDNLIIRKGSSDQVIIFLFNSESNITVDNNKYLFPASDITDGYFIRFTCNRSTWSYAYDVTFYPYTWQTNNNGFQINPSSDNFSLIFTNNVIINQYNYTIYGYNYTLSTPVYNGSTNVDIGEYYRLCRGFVGNYYYSNYDLIDYVIISNDTQEFIGNKYISYTPTSNGQIVDIYFYVEPSMNQKGYKVVTYYNDEVLYQKNEYNTLLINGRWFFWR